MKDLYKDAKARAMKKAGAGWSLLGEELRRGLVAAEVLGVLQAQAAVMSDAQRGGDLAPAFGEIAELSRMVFADDLG